jgi:hypothetical protein
MELLEEAVAARDGRRHAVQQASQRLHQAAGAILSAEARNIADVIRRLLEPARARARVSRRWPQSTLDPLGWQLPRPTKAWLVLGAPPHGL